MMESSLLEANFLPSILAESVCPSTMTVFSIFIRLAATGSSTFFAESFRSAEPESKRIGEEKVSFIREVVTSMPRLPSSISFFSSSRTFLAASISLIFFAAPFTPSSFWRLAMAASYSGFFWLKEKT